MARTFTINLFSAFVGDLVLPVFSLFLPLIAYQLGANIFEVGVVGGMSYGVYSFMPVVMGHYSDKMRMRRHFILVALITVGTSSLLYAFASSPLEVIGIRAVEGVGWAMFWPLLDAEVGAEVSADISKSFSVFNSVWSLAAMIGPLFGVALALLLPSLQSVFLVNAFILFATAAVNLLPRRSGAPAPKVGATSEVHHSSGSGNPYGIAVFMIAVIFSSAIRGILFTFFPPLGQSLGISIGLIGTIAFAFGAARFLAFLVTTKDTVRTRLLRSNHLKRNMALIMILTSLAGLLPVIMGSNIVLYFLSFGIVGGGFSALATVAQIAMITQAEPERIGRNSGLYESSVGIGMSMGPIVSGVFSKSLYTPFLLSPLWLVVTLVPMLILFRRSERSITSTLSEVDRRVGKAVAQT